MEIEFFDLARGREILKWCDSFTRLPTLVPMAWLMEPRDWLTLLGEEWSTCDNFSEHIGDLVGDTPLEYVLDDGSLRECLMTPEENSAWRELPDQVEVWRGCYRENRWGLSWTLDRATAERFPRLHRYSRAGEQPLLVRALAKKEDIAAVKLDRQEAEIIAWRPRHISTSHIPARATEP